MTACGSNTSSASPVGAKNCASGTGRVGYIPRIGTDPYMTKARDSATATAAKIGGSVVYASPDDVSGPAQAPAVNQLVEQGVCVIAIAGNDLNSTGAALAVVYGQENADVSTEQVKALIQAYPNLRGIIVADGTGLEAAARTLSQVGLLGDVKLTGLGPASQLKSYIKAGAVQDIWWNVTDLGALSYCPAQALAMGKITGAPGETFEAGELGTFTIGDKGEVTLGPARLVTPRNVDSFVSSPNVETGG